MIVNLKKTPPSPLKSNKIEPPSVTKDIVAIIAADNKGLVADLIEQYLMILTSTVFSKIVSKYFHYFHYFRYFHHFH